MVRAGDVAPDQPRYYLGGKVIPAAEIPAADVRSGYNQLVRSKARASRIEQIEHTWRIEKGALDRAVTRYKELIRRGKGPGWCESMALYYSEVRYLKGVLRALEGFAPEGHAFRGEPRQVPMF